LPGRLNLHGELTLAPADFPFVRTSAEESKNLSDAIFAVNDLKDIGEMMVHKKNGLKIPGDVALVGFTES